MQAETEEFVAKLLRAEDGVHFFPIRHHSPAVSLHLARAFAELRPRQVLIELPADFAALVPVLLDPATRAPVAIVAMGEEKDENAARAAMYWPFSATAPEYAAFRMAHESGAAVVAIDLPAGAREQEAAPEPGAPIVLTDERRIDTSDYIHALVQRLGCRDFNEAWDRLFEARAAETDWRRFFADLGVHCLLARATTPDEEMERDGTLAREAHMRQCLETAIKTPERPIAVVTGGFHTPPLLNRPAMKGKAATIKTRPMQAWLVRFSDDRLDRLNGYAAGMPSPTFYERLQSNILAGGETPFAACAESVFLDFAARLRREQPGLAPNVPALVAALDQARGLAALRGLPGPLRWEILDAALSCFVKDEDPRYGVPVLEELVRDLRGNRLGDVPPGAGSPPLVEAARARARSLGFTLDNSVPRSRDLDIHRNARHLEASRFLHAMALLETGFGRLDQGPDYASGVDLDALFEIWTYSWTPLVEARLIEIAVDGDTIERACTAALGRMVRALEQKGQGRSAAQAARLVFIAAQAGLRAAAADLLRRIEPDIAADADLASVAGALSDLFVLWRARTILGMSGSAELGDLLAACYRRALALAQVMAETPADRVSAQVGALAGMRSVLDSARADALFDAELFDEAVTALVDQDLPPLLEGAVVALAVSAGRQPPDLLGARLAGRLAGATVDPAERVAPIEGVIAVAPELLRRLDGLIEHLDDVVSQLEEEDFVRLLPHLRSTFTALDPYEVDGMARRIAARHGRGDSVDLTAPVPVPPHELTTNLKKAQALSRLLESDGLGHWLAPEDAA